MRIDTDRWKWCLCCLMISGCGMDTPSQPAGNNSASSAAESAEPQHESQDPHAAQTTVAATTDDSAMKAQTYVIPPSDNVQFELQARLIEAVPGDVIQLEAGRYVLNRQLDAVADNLTIRGKGSDQTVLTFKPLEYALPF